MSASPPIHPDLLAFFNYTRHRVKAEDIAANVMDDPGYPLYLDSWETIRRTGLIPHQWSIYLEEGMAWVAVSDGGKKRDLNGLRAFRRFSHSVGMVYTSWHCCNQGEFIPLNYLALNMVRDLIPGNQAYLDMARKALAALQTSLHAGPECNEYPFLLMAEILLAQKDRDFMYAHQIATTLIEAESRIRRGKLPVKDKRFLLGLTFYNTLHQKWLDVSCGLANPGKNPEMALLIGLLDELRS